MGVVRDPLLRSECYFVKFSKNTWKTGHEWTRELTEIL